MEASFGRLLREHRLSAGLSQEELAERAGLSVRAVSDMERGRTTHPYPRSVRLLVVALGLSAGDAERLVAATAARERDMPPEPESGPRQLPAPVRDFVGRVTELRQLDDLLADVETGARRRRGERHRGRRQDRAGPALGARGAPTGSRTASST